MKLWPEDVAQDYHLIFNFLAMTDMRQKDSDLQRNDIL